MSSNEGNVGPEDNGGPGINHDLEMAMAMAMEEENSNEDVDVDVFNVIESSEEEDNSLPSYNDSDDSNNSDPNFIREVVPNLRSLSLRALNIANPNASVDLERQRLLPDPVAATLSNLPQEEPKTAASTETKDTETTESLAITSKPTLPDRLRCCSICQLPGDLACGGCFHVVYCSAEHQLDDWNSHQKHCNFYSLHRQSFIKYQGPFRFRPRDPKGPDYQMEAPCTIPEKTLILEETPFFTAPWPRLKIRKSETAMTPGLRPLCLTCFGCCKMLQFDFTACSTCNIPICSENCPFISKHKDNECKYLKQMQRAIGQPDKFDLRTEGSSLMDDQATELLYMDIMILRFLLLHNKLQRECGDPEKWTAIWENLTTTWKLSSDKRIFRSKRGKLVSQNMEATLPLSSFATKGQTTKLWNIFCLLEENTLLMDLPFRRLKVLTNATINARHSCAPNSYAFLKHDDTYNLDNLAVAVISGKKLEPGEAITISYCPLIFPTTQRQPFLMDQYLFWCLCSRCLDPTECGTCTNSLKCPICGNSYIVPAEALANKYDLLSPPNYKLASYVWKCSNDARCPSHSNCSSYENTTTSSAHRALLSSAMVLPKLERYELESVIVLGSYQKTQRLIRNRSGELHPNSHIFLKIYDDILKGAIYPIAGNDGEHLTEFSVEWLQTLSKAKDAYTAFMKKICPAFDFQGFPEENHMVMETEFYKLSDSNINGASVSVTNFMDNLGNILIRPSTIRPIIRGIRHLIEVRRPRISSSTVAESTRP